MDGGVFFRLVNWLVFLAKSTTKDYIMAKMFNLPVIYAACKSSNHKLSKTTESVLTQTHIKQKIHEHQTQHFGRISAFVIALVKAMTHWYCGPFYLSISDFKKIFKKKEWTEAIKKVI